ncbi:DUF3299 domain-containing protein [Alteromonas sp. ASW11-36]|uniref:DUF3299 domain-containing protein n=1 Tax=Alteromonas arenosi TaxID=3055817 RepID=A0ABT7SSI6_9ALTE|nr:DUF3299 domain-containing protein [Alteromonas sp. ASW11-36]MDM7859158.1 DUF3299 domain-containing protein [Alteromonas sp. ASW11-36]
MLGLLFFTTAISAEEYKEVWWEDLMPEGFEIPTAPPVNHLGNMSQALPNAPVVGELNGQSVKIPGFVVPLEGTAEMTTEFLLVPYFGACVHVPPPPSNQIVYVKFTEGVPIDNLYDAVWVSGVLSTEGWSGDIASVGYTLSGASVTPFDG